MKLITLHELLKQVYINPSKNFVNPIINNISFNSKDVAKGTLFLGLLGAKVDGGIYWKEALKNGAEAAIISKNAEKISGKVLSDKVLVMDGPLDYIFGQLIAELWERPSKKLNLIGVTGTNGKTTIAFLLEYLCNELGTNAALFGTLFNRWQGYSENSSHTTDFADKLQPKLYKAFEAKSKIAILEVSSHAIAQKRISGCEFKGAIFTNLSQDHLDYHKSMEAYFEAKQKLFNSPYLSESNSVSVINFDDKWGKKLSKKIKGKVFLVSTIINKKNIEYKNLFYLSSKELRDDGTFCTFNTPKEKIELYIPLLGDFNLMNALQSITLLYSLGFPLKRLAESLKKFPGVPGRMERVIFDKDKYKSFLPEVIVDYAHSPEGLKNVLETLRIISKKKIITVFGCGGDRDKKKRPLMGEVAERLSDTIFITSDNPRNENEEVILNDILLGIKEIDKVKIEKDRYLAIEKAIYLADEKNIVLIAGKGHENYQILNNSTIDFDDRKIALKLLKEKFSQKNK